MKSNGRSLLGTYIGAGLGFIGFVLVGAVPGLLYGGYAGLALAATMNGTPVEPTFVTRLLVWGGMALGSLAVLSFFLVMGALVGTLGHLFWVFFGSVRAELAELKKM